MSALLIDYQIENKYIYYHIVYHAPPPPMYWGMCSPITQSANHDMNHSAPACWIKKFWSYLKICLFNISINMVWWRRGESIQYYYQTNVRNWIKVHIESKAKTGFLFIQNFLTPQPGSIIMRIHVISNLPNYFIV